MNIEFFFISNLCIRLKQTKSKDFSKFKNTIYILIVLDNVFFLNFFFSSFYLYTYYLERSMDYLYDNIKFELYIIVFFLEKFNF